MVSEVAKRFFGTDGKQGCLCNTRISDKCSNGLQGNPVEVLWQKHGCATRSAAMYVGGLRLVLSRMHNLPSCDPNLRYKRVPKQTSQKLFMLNSNNNKPCFKQIVF